MDIGYRNDGVPGIELTGTLGHLGRKLVAKDTGIFKIGLLAGKGMEIRAANTDPADEQHDLTLCCYRFRNIKELEMAGFPAADCFHGKQDASWIRAVQVSRAC